MTCTTHYQSMSTREALSSLKTEIVKFFEKDQAKNKCENIKTINMLILKSSLDAPTKNPYYEIFYEAIVTARNHQSDTLIDYIEYIATTHPNAHYEGLNILAELLKFFSNKYFRTLQCRQRSNANINAIEERIVSIIIQEKNFLPLSNAMSMNLIYSDIIKIIYDRYPTQLHNFFENYKEELDVWFQKPTSITASKIASEYGFEINFKFLLENRITNWCWYELMYKPSLIFLFDNINPEWLHNLPIRTMKRIYKSGDLDSFLEFCPDIINFKVMDKLFFVRHTNIEIVSKYFDLEELLNIVGTDLKKVRYHSTKIDLLNQLDSDEQVAFMKDVLEESFQKINNLKD